MAGALRAALRPAFAARQIWMDIYPRKNNSSSPHTRPGSALLPIIVLQMRAQLRRQVPEMLDMAR